MDLSDFSDRNFDPIKWINQKIDESNCTEQLMKLELLTSDLSNHLEDLTFKTIKTILPVELELGRLQSESLSLANTLSDIISQKVHKNEPGLHALIQMNELKENMKIVKDGFQKIIKLQDSIKGIEQYFVYIQTVQESGDGEAEDSNQFDVEDAVCVEIEKIEGCIEFFKSFLGRYTDGEEKSKKVEMQFPDVESYKNALQGQLFPRFHKLMINKKDYIHEAEIAREDDLTKFKKIARILQMFSRLGRVENVLRSHIHLLLEEHSERIFKSPSATDLTPIFNNLVHFIDTEFSFYEIHLKFLAPHHQTMLSAFLSLTLKILGNPNSFPLQTDLPKIILQYRQTRAFLTTLENRYGLKKGSQEEEEEGEEESQGKHNLHHHQQQYPFIKELFEKYRVQYPQLEKKHVTSLIPILCHKKKKQEVVVKVNEDQFFGKSSNMESLEEDYEEVIGILDDSVGCIKKVCLDAISRCREFTDGRCYKDLLKVLDGIFESMIGRARKLVREVMVKFLAPPSPTHPSGGRARNFSPSSGSSSPVSIMIKSLRLVRISSGFYERVRRLEHEIRKVLTKEKERIGAQQHGNHMDSQTKSLIHYIRSLEEVNLPVFERKSFVGFQKYCEGVAMSVLFGEIQDMFSLYIKRGYWREEGKTNIREYIIRVGEHLNLLPELLADHLSNEDHNQYGEETNEEEVRTTTTHFNWLEEVCEKCVEELKIMILRIPVLKNDPSIQLAYEIEHLCSIMKILDQEKQTGVLNSIKVILEQCSRETYQRKRSSSSLDAKWLTEFTKIRAFQ